MLLTEIVLNLKVPLTSLKARGRTVENKIEIVLKTELLAGVLKEC